MGIRYICKYFFLFLHKNIQCGYSLEAPQNGASNEYHNICFSGEIRKKINTFELKNTSYLELWDPNSVMLVVMS